MPTRVMLPLPVEPAPPAFVAQDATAQGAANLAETAMWRYRLRYWHQHAAQDKVFVTAAFNVVPESDEASIVPESAPSRLDDRLCARLVYSDDGEHMEALQLTRELDGLGLSRRWPSVGYFSPGGSSVDLGSGTGDDTTRTYAFDPPLVFEGWSHTFDLTWDALPLPQVQNATASLSVARNRGLVPEGATAVVLVYRTGILDALNVVAPLNRWLQDIDISELGDTVEIALGAILFTLFGECRIGQPVALEIGYGYQLQPQAEPDAALVTTVPVAMVPRQLLTAETVTQIIATLATWKNEIEPETTGGHWVFSLKLFSSIDMGTPLPLLELGRLVYRLGATV